jgi:hypothetical protein
MKLRRLLAVLVALAVLYVVRSMRERSAESPRPATTEKYAPTVQEGLGASVAILLDNSGSMEEAPGTGGGSKAAIAREVLERVLSQTDSFVTRQPGFPVNVGLYVFNKRVVRALPIGPYDGARFRATLAALKAPDGGTAIGDAMEVAVTDLYSAGTIRKYILVVTDGENTEGADPAEIAAEIERRSEGAVRLFLVAFDVEGDKFGFVSHVRGTLVEARDAVALRAGLDTLYRGRILAEAVDAGETLRDTVLRK